MKDCWSLEKFAADLGAAGEPDRAVGKSFVGEGWGVGQAVVMRAEQDAVFQVCSPAE